MRKKKRPKQAERLTIGRRKVILQIEKALARKRLAPYRFSQEKDDRRRLEAMRRSFFLVFIAVRNGPCDLKCNVHCPADQAEQKNDQFKGGKH